MHNSDGSSRTLLAELFRGRSRGESLRLVRFCMVLLVFAPLFLLEAIRGVGVLPSWWDELFFLSLILFPALVVAARIGLVWRTVSPYPMSAGKVEEVRWPWLVSALSIMLLFFGLPLETERDLAVFGLLTALVLFCCQVLGWHFLNWLVPMLGYRVYQVSLPMDPAGLGRRSPLFLITRRRGLQAGAEFPARRITDSLYWETGR